MLVTGSSVRYRGYRIFEGVGFIIIRYEEKARALAELEKTTEDIAAPFVFERSNDNRDAGSNGGPSNPPNAYPLAP